MQLGTVWEAGVEIEHGITGGGGGGGARRVGGDSSVDESVSLKAEGRMSATSGGTR